MEITQKNFKKIFGNNKAQFDGIVGGLAIYFFSSGDLDYTLSFFIDGCSMFTPEESIAELLEWNQLAVIECHQGVIELYKKSLDMPILHHEFLDN